MPVIRQMLNYIFGKGRAKWHYKQKEIHLYGDKPFDFVLFITVLILLSMGIIMVLSASSPQALAESGNSYSYVTRQAIFAVIGIVLMVIISKIDYRIYSKFSTIGYIGSVIIHSTIFIYSTNCIYINIFAKPFKCYNYYLYSSINYDVNGRN